MKIIYRPEVDALRAIAVISVIIYHAEIEVFNYQLFKGGFLGVDIFFVISGYLITSLIFKELNEKMRHKTPILWVYLKQYCSRYSEFNDFAQKNRN
jgi:peptidoglycan/LPS O-acetylase OafA/YrhL